MSTNTAPRRGEERDRQVRRVLVIEGAANALVLALKLIVGFATSSLAVLGDAIHSLTDVANNVVAWFIVRYSAAPADREHPYGHRKFETLAVFALATLLSVLAIELALGALRREPTPIRSEGWAVGVMIAVLACNLALAAWERAWSRRLDSPILEADAKHTFADVLTTVAVIGGWQLAARGYPWLDQACAFGVAGFVLYLAFGLFRRAIPVLVDTAAIDVDELSAVAHSVAGVRTVTAARSRSVGSGAVIDLVVTVEPSLSTARSHAIADAVEREVQVRFAAEHVTVHVEPHREQS